MLEGRISDDMRINGGALEVLLSRLIGHAQIHGGCESTEFLGL